MQPVIHDHPFSRRQWLRACASAGLLGTLGSAALLAGRSAAAAAGDYRALVCVYLFGGNDSANCVIPRDTNRYAKYSQARRILAVPKTDLVSLAVNPGNPSSKPYGLHPALAPLAPLWATNKLAVMFNTGPLVKPVKQAAVMNGKQLPPALFSHAEQQTLWETASTTVQTTTGWGGRAMAGLLPATPLPTLAVLERASRFGTEPARMALTLPQVPDDFGPTDLIGQTWAPLAARRAAMDALMVGRTDLNQIATQQAAFHNGSMALAEATDNNSLSLSPVLAATPGNNVFSTQALIDAAFDAQGLISNGAIAAGIPGQLYQTAKLIAVQSSEQAGLGGKRQVFLVGNDGFDTHADQISVPGSSSVKPTHHDKLDELARGLAAFANAMDALGLGSQVTSFTQSEFGRTLKPNDRNGSDHGWGGHQFILGGAVRGGLTYGKYPNLDIGGPDDVTNDPQKAVGRWIPTSSVDQYAATLLKWFDPTLDLPGLLPNLAHFSSSDLGFMHPSS